MNPQGHRCNQNYIAYEIEPPFSAKEEKGQEYKAVYQEKTQIGNEGPPGLKNMFPVYSFLKIPEEKWRHKHKEPEYHRDKRFQELQMIDSIYMQIHACLS